MKILIFNNLYYPHGQGGAEKYVSLLDQGMKGNGHETLVVSAKPFFFLLIKKAPWLLRLAWHAWSYINPAVYWRLYRCLGSFKPDLAVTNNLAGFAPSLPLLLSAMSIKHFHVLHDIQLLHPSGLMYKGGEGIINTPIAKIYQKINVFVFRSVARIISPSRWLLDLHTEHGIFSQQNSTVLPNPVDIKPVSRQNRSSDKFVFLFVGRLTKAKGWPLLREAYQALLKTRSRDVTRYELRVMSYEVKEMTEKDGIKYIPQTRADEALTAMTMADRLVVPSLCYENSPTVIYEAKAAGLPVLAARTGGIPELLACPPDQAFEPEPKALAMAMADALDEREAKAITPIKNPGLPVREYCLRLLKAA